ncbi:STAS domain-containing protein, partial [Candidatus Riflebacteria bacterium]
VDLSELLFINSMGLGFLAAWSEKVKNEKGSMKIANLSENLQDLFYLTQMDKILSLYENTDAAKEAFTKED